MKAGGGERRELEKRQGPACSWEPPRAVPVRMGVYVCGGKWDRKSLGKAWDRRCPSSSFAAGGGQEGVRSLL